MTVIIHVTTYEMAPIQAMHMKKERGKNFAHVGPMRTSGIVRNSRTWKGKNAIHQAWAGIKENVDYEEMLSIKV